MRLLPWIPPLRETGSAMLLSLAALAGSAEAFRYEAPYGVMIGDVTSDAAVIWSRSNLGSARMVVYWRPHEEEDYREVAGPAALETTDYTAKTILTGLPAGAAIEARVRFVSLEDADTFSEAGSCSFRTAPGPDVPSRTIRFCWSGDTAGQGWGIDRARGGMRIYETMRQLDPDFFLHSGDLIYADNPLQAEVTLDDGTVWRNVVIPAKAKVAETLEEFRGNFAYNFLDQNFRRFHFEVPVVVQWDDHETINNWYPDERLTTDDRYTVKSAALLSARARRAFFEYTPIRPAADDPERIYRKIAYGPKLDLFVVDQRSYRAPNSPNRQAEAAGAAAFLGVAQMSWLQRELDASTAAWKIIASDMPIGLVVRDGENDFEAVANGDDGAPLGRELEIAALLSFLRERNIRNVVWLTADVHYAASHHYDPERASFQDFLPFWEFVSGPLHAGTFGPNALDGTFGPEEKFRGIPEGMLPNRSPAEGFQFFGVVEIDGANGLLTVEHRNVAGERLWSVEVEPAPGG